MQQNQLLLLKWLQNFTKKKSKIHNLLRDFNFVLFSFILSRDWWEWIKLTTVSTPSPYITDLDCCDPTNEEKCDGVTCSTEETTLKTTAFVPIIAF